MDIHKEVVVATIMGDGSGREPGSSAPSQVLLKPSFIPPREHRELRDLTRYRRKLINMVSANKNCIIKTLEEGNVKLSSVLGGVADKRHILQ